LDSGYFQHNISIFWLDASEPEISTGPARAAAFASEYSKGSAYAAGMMYPYWHTQAVHDGLVSAGQQDGDIIMLTRSAWAGMQRFGAALWSGDTSSHWGSLKVSLAAGLNTQLSGIAWWTTDIGGYSGGNPSDPDFRQLVVRWFQYGATCPLFRQHGARETEIWKLGDESYAAIVKVINWRKSIKEYVMEQMRVVSETGTPVNRPLWWDFPEDQQAWNQTASFMFGPKYLVSPVTEANASSWTSYLPAGAKWQYYFDASKTFEGGQEVSLDTPLDEFPLFVRVTSETLVV
jgi:alpha-D-xyloside xylohydrolase